MCCILQTYPSEKQSFLVMYVTVTVVVAAVKILLLTILTMTRCKTFL